MTVADPDGARLLGRGGEASERKYLARIVRDYNTAPWLFGLSFNDMRNSKWKALVLKIEEEARSRPHGHLLSELHKA